MSRIVICKVCETEFVAPRQRGPRQICDRCRRSLAIPQKKHGGYINRGWDDRDPGTGLPSDLDDIKRELGIP